MNAGRPRVSLISHVYLEGYTGKLRALASLTDLRLVVPSAYPTPYASAEPLLANGEYVVDRYRVGFPFWRKSSTRWILYNVDLGFRRWSPDIVHVENERHSSVVLQVWAARKRFAPRARLVVFVWENHRSGLLRERVTVPLGRWMARRVDLFIAGNEDARALLQQDGVAPERIVVLPVAGVAPEWFRPAVAGEREALRAELGIGQRDLVVGFVGRIEPEKGIRELSAALRQVAQAQPARPVNWLIVGRGSLLGEVTNATGVGVRVTPIRPQRHREVARYYRAMDVLVLPSLTTRAWKEQFGRVLVEAMACRIPVVGSDSGAIPEVIGDAGRVVPEGDVRALAVALRELEQDPALGAQLGRRGIDRVRRLFTDEAVARRTFDAYERVLALPRLGG